MKKILLIISLMLFSIGVNAQILPVEQLNELTGKVHEQITGIRHIKDVNGVLDKYVGTWKGTFDGKELELVIKEYTRDHSIFVQDYHPEPLLWDELIGKIKITDQNGTVLVNTMDKPDDSMEIMIKYRYYDASTYVLKYIGDNFRCGDKGEVYLDMQSSTVIHFLFHHTGGIAPSCDSEPTTTFPTDNSIVMIKQ